MGFDGRLKAVGVRVFVISNIVQKCFTTSYQPDFRQSDECRVTTGRTTPNHRYKNIMSPFILFDGGFSLGFDGRLKAVDGMR